VISRQDGPDQGRIERAARSQPSGHYALGRGYLALDDDAGPVTSSNRLEPRVSRAAGRVCAGTGNRASLPASLAAAALTAGPVSRPLAKQDGAEKPERLSDVEALASGAGAM